MPTKWGSGGEAPRNLGPIWAHLGTLAAIPFGGPIGVSPMLVQIIGTLASMSGPLKKAVERLSGFGIGQRVSASARAPIGDSNVAPNRPK